MSVLRNCATQDCVGYNGKWLNCVEQVFVQNKVHPVVYGSGLRDYGACKW